MGRVTCQIAEYPADRNSGDQTFCYCGVLLYLVVVKVVVEVVVEVVVKVVVEVVGFFTLSYLAVLDCNWL